MANQIAIILYDFGSYKEAIHFAEKSNEIYILKDEILYIEKVLDNRLVISKANEMLDKDQESLEQCEKTFNLVTRRKIWKARFGKYIVEILKVTFKVLVKKQPHTRKCNIYYILDLIHISFQKKIPVILFFFFILILGER